MGKGIAGSFRANSLDASDLSAMERHELRLDYSGHRRSTRKGVDNKAIPPLIYNPYQMNSLTQAHAAHVEGARINKGADKICRHAFVQFPTALEITPQTEQMMLDQAVAFVNKTHGGNAVFWARLDRDEAGRHGVDVFFAPRYEKATKRKAETWISLTKFGKERAIERFGQRELEAKNPKTGKFEKVKAADGKPVMVDCDSKFFQGRAFQDLWFEHLRDVVGLDWVQRGTRKVSRDPDRLEVEEYKLRQEREKLAAKEKHLAALDYELAADERQLVADQEEFAAARRELERTRIEAEETMRRADALRASLEPFRAAVEALEAHEVAEAVRRAQEADDAIVSAAVPKLLESVREHGPDPAVFAVLMTGTTHELRTAIAAEIDCAPDANPLEFAQAFTQYDPAGQASFFADFRDRDFDLPLSHAVRDGIVRLQDHAGRKDADAAFTVRQPRLQTVMALIRKTLTLIGKHLGLVRFKPAPPPPAAAPLLALPEPVQQKVRDALTQEQPGQLKP
ncbi:MAG: hypothetical protein IOC89_06030 [Rhodobacter sp.]|nr:hypothetical protein [Rhodobacter sp.]